MRMIQRLGKVTGRRTALISAALATTLVLGGCAGGGQSSAPGAADAGPPVVRFGTLEPNSLIPGNVRGIYALAVSQNLFSGLVSYDPQTGEAVNLIAEDISSTDQQEWDITLQPGWTFHNGEPVDAESFARAWNATADPDNAWLGAARLAAVDGYAEAAAGDVDEISGVEVTDDLTLTVTLSQPDAQFPLQLGHPAFYPMPAAALDDLEAYGREPIGNGPYQMTAEWTGGPSITTERFEEYGGTPAANPGIEFKIYNGYDIAYRDFQGGQLDITALISSDVSAARAQYGDKVGVDGASAFTYLAIPTWHEAFDDPQMRQALSMAIDRPALIEAFLGDTTTVAEGFTSPSVAGYLPACAEHCRFDPEAAKALFDEAGGFEGTLTITYPSGTGREGWAEAIGNRLRTNLGIEETAIEAVPSENILALIRDQQIPNPTAQARYADNPSTGGFLSSSYSSTGASNFAFYENPEFDATLAEAIATDDAATFAQAQEMLKADMPVIPLFDSAAGHVVSERTTSYNTDPFNPSRLQEVVLEGH